MKADEGLVGLGETFVGAAAVETYPHEILAPALIGRSPLQKKRITLDLPG